MKKFFILSFILLSLSSCSIDEDSSNYNNYSFEILPVDSVDIPDKFILGEVYPIKIYYLNPSSCNSFKEFYYFKENNQRTVAPITYKFEENNCETLQDVKAEATLNFEVTSNGSYIFNFWQGEDDNGEDKYLTIEVPVEEETTN